MTIRQHTWDYGTEVATPDGNGIIAGRDGETDRWKVLIGGIVKIYHRSQLNERELSVTGRDADCDSFVLGYGARLVRGAEIAERAGCNWEVLTNDGWELFQRAELTSFGVILIRTDQNPDGWYRSTDAEADDYLSQVRPYDF